ETQAAGKSLERFGARRAAQRGHVKDPRAAGEVPAVLDDSRSIRALPAHSDLRGLHARAHAFELPGLRLRLAPGEVLGARATQRRQGGIDPHGLADVRAR